NTSNGGFIETSAAHVKIADSAKITTASAMGLAGSWLIDPVDFTIAASGGDMTGAAVNSALTSTNFTIQSTTGAAGTSGNVNINDAVSWSANKLTLNAQNNIHINANLNASGTASLALEYGQGAVAAGNTSNYHLNGAQVNLPAGQNFSIKLGSDGTTTAYTVITTLGAQGSTTGTDLQGINGNLGGNYVLGANVEAIATNTWNAGAGFVPLGNPGAYFIGKFDGLGHTINNLTINRPSTDFVGLFGIAAYNSTVRNVGLINSSVTGSNFVGTLVGQNNVTINNAYATGNVAGSGNSVGGLVGRNNGSISNAYATGGVTGSVSHVGGLVGMNVGSISNAYATGSVTGNNNVGGLVGYNSGGNINNTYATGSISSPSYWAGGLVGFSYGGSTSNSFSGLSTAQMQAQATFTGFDFANTWVMYEGHTTALLRSFMTPLTVSNASKTYDGQAVGVSAFGLPASNIFGTLRHTQLWWHVRRRGQRRQLHGNRPGRSLLQPARLHHQLCRRHTDGEQSQPHPEHQQCQQDL
ncbi:MAG: hypothetical protein FD135_5556, partial [Comamonadaceae bacterium]